MKVEELTDLQLAQEMNQAWSRFFAIQNQIQIIKTEIEKRNIKKDKKE